MPYSGAPQASPIPIRTRLLAAVAVVAGLLALAAQEGGGLNAAERATVDARFGFRGTQPPDDRVAIVALDQKSLREFDEQQPISRERYAGLLDRLREADPRLVAIAVQFTGAAADRAADRALIAAVERNGPVLLGTHDTSAGPLPVPAGRQGAPGALQASVAVDTDPDNVVRRMLLAPVALKTLAVRAAELYTGTIIDENRFPDNRAWIAYRGPPSTFRTYSFVDVLEGRVPTGAFDGKAVLIGVTDPSAKDVFVTSASGLPMAGVEVHANALSTILDGFPLHPLGGALEVVLVLALAALPALLGIRFSALPMLIATLALLALLLLGIQLAFNSGWILPVLGPLLALALSAIGCTGADAFLERRRRRALQSALGRLMPPESPRAFFISYRRDESAWPARMLRDELVRRFGSTSVFMDTASLRAGQEWPRRIDDALRGCSVLLVLISRSWLARDGADGARRIDDPRDWVRREIEAVLIRPDAIVVPVLLDGATMPAEEDLPASLRPLADHQGAALSADDLASDIDDLIRSIEQGRIHDHAATAAVTMRLTTEPVGERSGGRFAPRRAVSASSDSGRRGQSKTGRSA